MKLLTLSLLLAVAAQASLGSPLLEDVAGDIEKRDTPGFVTGQPIGNGKGGPILGKNCKSGLTSSDVPTR